MIDGQWLDGSGAPLKRPTGTRSRPSQPSSVHWIRRLWTIALPGAGGRVPRIEAHETRWVFVPAEPWRAGEHTLEIAPHLEDPAGNRLGRAFEVMERVAEPSDAARGAVPGPVRPVRLVQR